MHVKFVNCVNVNKKTKFLDFVEKFFIIYDSVLEECYSFNKTFLLIIQNSGGYDYGY